MSHIHAFPTEDMYSPEYRTIFNTQTAWTNEEEIALCKGWVHVSENSSKCNARKDAGFFTKVLKGSPKWMDTEGPNFAAKHQASKRYKTYGSISFNTDSEDASINLNVDVGDDEEDEVQVLRRPISTDKAKSLKKKGSKSSGSSSSTNDEALARLMVSELAMHIKHAIKIKKSFDLIVEGWSLGLRPRGLLLTVLGQRQDKHFRPIHYASLDERPDERHDRMEGTSRWKARSDGSTRDLYPVIAPSPIPYAFLVIQHTLHQCLGHPGGEMLRRLVSFNFISYNKEKPHVLCLALQLGKHVRLLFVISNGTLSRYKAYRIANGSTQLEWVDVNETFSPVVKLGTVRSVLSLAAFRHWPIHQLDVKNAFLHGDLSETIYMHRPLGFQDSVHPDYKKYAVEILDRAHMVNCNPSHTPIDTESKLRSDGDIVVDPTLYRSLADLVAYSDADWAGCPTTRRSTFEYFVFLGNNLLSWSSKHQPMLSHSSAEVEYRGVANAVAETCWLRNLLHELHTLLSSATLVNCDNVRVLHVPSRYQYADIFTKGLPPASFEEFRSSLSVWCPSATTTREC
nr:ribonuclease H-like domain-containing protein [Tanacetum cinerariifolium]